MTGTTEFSLGRPPEGLTDAIEQRPRKVELNPEHAVLAKIRSFGRS